MKDFIRAAQSSRYRATQAMAFGLLWTAATVAHLTASPRQIIRRLASAHKEAAQ